MSHDGNKATEMKFLNNNDAPVAIGNEKPVPPNGIKLVEGIFVDKAGQPVSAVKPNIWY